MLQSVTQFGPRLAELECCLEHGRKERFITSDPPLAQLGPRSTAMSSRVVLTTGVSKQLHVVVGQLEVDVGVVAHVGGQQ